ncbi:MAG TPA: hypothetical protein VK742_20740 [Candidatus Sulfotelmatobacter sp.]|jgi:hypothetical protein|nr:hypothetical protein [Candidatus Sulfotelmatobacter sp.]
MKILLQPRARHSGFALIMVLIIVTASLMILASDMSRSQSVSIQNNHNVDFTACSAMAEGAVEKVFARMAYDFQSYNVSGVSNNCATGVYKNNIPNVSENAAVTGYVFSDGQGHTGQTYVYQTGTYTGPLPSAYQGLYAAPGSPIYRIVSNVQRTNSTTGVSGTAQEDVLLAMVPLNTWAIFYNGLLEFTQCATMTVNGRVQANGPIYVGTSASLTFNSGVSCTHTLTAPLVDGLGSGWTPNNPSTWNTTFNATPGYTTNVASVTVSLNMTNSHFLIDIPPAGESPSSQTGMQRLYNQAQMVLLVTNSPTGTNPMITLTVQTSVNGAEPGADTVPAVISYTNATPGVLASNLDFLSLTNTTYDQREEKTNLFTQIDIGQFSTWISTNSSVQSILPAVNTQYPTILYVADRRNTAATQLASVRLVNGAQLPANGNIGFTVATPNPLYVWGNYNVQTATSAANASAATTNTAATVPAALMSDSLTILSSSWTDSQGFTTYSQSATADNASASETINAAIVTGTVPSTGTSGTTFSGGVHNLPRLLEDWSSSDLWLNTSILRLWDSDMATNQFRNPAGFSPAPVNPFYNPPTRHFSFDPNFLNPSKVPPGIPVALVPIRFDWGVPPPGSVTYSPPHD